MTGLTPLVDTHCHLALDRFQPDLQAVLDRARQAGVQTVVVPGINPATSRRAVQLADRIQGLFAAVGLHPNEASQWSPDLVEDLRDLAASDSVVAIGEIGLDYYREFAPREAQHAAFQAQLELAAELELPVIVHIRESAQAVLRELLGWAERVPAVLSGRTGVLHAFSSNLADGVRAAEAGFYLGVAGPITYPKAERRRQVAAELPADRLLVETDAPYMTPHPHRGKRNEPAHVRLVAAALADLRGEALPQLAQATTSNAEKLFGWNHGTGNRHLL